MCLCGTRRMLELFSVPSGKISRGPHGPFKQRTVCGARCRANWYAACLQYSTVLCYVCYASTKVMRISSDGCFIRLALKPYCGLHSTRRTRSTVQHVSRMNATRSYRPCYSRWTHGNPKNATGTLVEETPQVHSHTARWPRQHPITPCCDKQPYGCRALSGMR